MAKYTTIGLFIERDKYRPYLEDPLFTLSKEDKEVHGVKYLSLRKLYVQEEDLGEYIFAEKHIPGGWAQWQIMVESSELIEHIQAWRTELELKLKSEALRAILDEARLGGKNSYNAKLFLVSKGYVQKETESSRRGRPSKAEINRLAQEEVLNNHKVDKDLERLLQ